MKNEKGFTLMELLAVIAILGLIITVAMPSIMNAVKKANINLCKNKSELILSAAELYAQDNENNLTYTTNNGKTTTTINISQLLEENYLEPDEKDDGECSNGCMINPISKVAIENTIKLEKKENSFDVAKKTYIATWENGDICNEE